MHCVIRSIIGRATTGIAIEAHTLVVGEASFDRSKQAAQHSLHSVTRVIRPISLGHASWRFDLHVSSCIHVRVAHFCSWSLPETVSSKSASTSTISIFGNFHSDVNTFYFKVKHHVPVHFRNKTLRSLKRNFEIKRWRLLARFRGFAEQLGLLPTAIAVPTTHDCVHRHASRAFVFWFEKVCFSWKRNHKRKSEAVHKPHTTLDTTKNHL